MRLNYFNNKSKIGGDKDGYRRHLLRLLWIINILLYNYILILVMAACTNNMCLYASDHNTNTQSFREDEMVSMPCWDEVAASATDHRRTTLRATLHLYSQHSTI